jgi:uncharacterized protein (DUF1501 family)
MTVGRRQFLVGSGAAAAMLATRPRLAFATPADPDAGDVLVLVFLRGGADGLSLVPPFSDTAGYQARRGAGTGNDVAVPPPDSGDVANTAIDLGAASGGHDFGLHPAATGLHGVWEAGDLAIVHAVGWPASSSASRSHFTAQATWDRGSADVTLGTGWLGRYLDTLGPSVTGVPGVGRGTTLPASLRGSSRASAIAGADGFAVTGFDDIGRARAALDAFHPAAADAPLSQLGAATLAAVDVVAAADPGADQSGAGLYQGFQGPFVPLAAGLHEIAQLIRADVGLRVACVDVGGWDTHDAMGPVSGGLMRDQVQGLSDALAAFHTDLGTALDEVTVVTISEFGRTIGVNGSNGTDHGRGSCLFVMGGHVDRGLYGDYPSGALTDGPEGDLAVTTDVRTVLTEVMTHRLDLADGSVLFPGYTHPGDLGLFG